MIPYMAIVILLIWAIWATVAVVRQSRKVREWRVEAQNMSKQYQAERLRSGG